MNLLTVSDALALRYAAAQLTAPSGLKAVTSSTSRPPNNIPNTPFVIVWPTDGELTYGAGILDAETAFDVVFYYSKAEGDIPREYVALQSWVGVLIAQLHGQVKLATAGVLKAMVQRWEIGTAVYAGTTYERITLFVHVWTQEAVTLTP